MPDRNIQSEFDIVVLVPLPDIAMKELDVVVLVPSTRYCHVSG